MNDMEKAQVIFDGLLAGTSHTSDLEAFGDAMMTALIDLEVEDPFVSVDGVDQCSRVSFVVNAAPGPASLAIGADLLDRALHMVGVPQRDGIKASSEALTPA